MRVAPPHQPLLPHARDAQYRRGAHRGLLFCAPLLRVDAPV